MSPLVVALLIIAIIIILIYPRGLRWVIAIFVIGLAAKYLIDRSPPKIIIGGGSMKLLSADDAHMNFVDSPLIVITGKSATGKSTLAHRFESTHQIIPYDGKNTQWLSQIDDALASGTKAIIELPGSHINALEDLTHREAKVIYLYPTANGNYAGRSTERQINSARGLFTKALQFAPDLVTVGV